MRKLKGYCLGKGKEPLTGYINGDWVLKIEDPNLIIVRVLDERPYYYIFFKTSGFNARWFSVYQGEILPDTHKVLQACEFLQDSIKTGSGTFFVSDRFIRSIKEVPDNIGDFFDHTVRVWSGQVLPNGVPARG